MSVRAWIRGLSKGVNRALVMASIGPKLGASKGLNRALEMVSIGPR